MGLRLKLRKAQAEAGDIVLLFADESEAMTHPYLARAWAKRGADLRMPAHGQAKKVAMMGAFDHAARRILVHTSKTKRSADFIALLERLDVLYGTKPDLRIKPVVIVLDNGPIDVSKATIAALVARAHWLTIEWLPKFVNLSTKFMTVLKAHPAEQGSLQQFALATTLQLAADAARGIPGERLIRPRENSN